MRYIDYKKLIFSRMPLLLYLPFDLVGQLIISSAIDVGASESLVLELIHAFSYNGSLEMNES